MPNLERDRQTRGYIAWAKINTTNSAIRTANMF